MKRIVTAAIFALSLSPLAAYPADTGFATLVAGAVVFKDGAPLTVFTKLRSGDQLLLKPGAKLQLVYFASGRQETWGSPCNLSIGERESSARECPDPGVKALPPMVLSALLNTPDLITDIRNRSGMVRVRAFADQEQVAADQAQYRSLREQAAPDDITPELYLFSRQWKFHLTSAMAETLAAMEQRQPNNPEVAALRAKYQKLLDGMEKKAPNIGQ
ncbi:MAG: hypothetical protein WC073_00255 [Sterolibacterium sp.]